MKNDNWKNILIIVLIIIVIILLIVVGYFGFHNKNSDKENINVNYTNDFLKDDTSNLENVITNVGLKYEVTLKNHKVSPMAIVKYEENGELQYANINIKGFKLNNIDSNIKIENLANNAICAMEDKPLNILLNDKNIASFPYEGCYLTIINEIFVVNEKYIGVLYAGESANYTVTIYNELGDEIYEREVVEFNSDKYTFKAFEEDDEKFIINDYKLAIKYNKLVDVLTEVGSESYCDPFNDYGYCK